LEVIECISGLYNDSRWPADVSHFSQPSLVPICRSRRDGRLGGPWAHSTCASQWRLQLLIEKYWPKHKRSLENSTWNNLEFRDFNFSRYPDYVRNLREFRWKPIIIAVSRAPVNLPFFFVACKTGPWVLLALGTRRASNLPSRLFVKNSDHRVGVLPTVRLTS
uniref:Calpain catalytic domain-containing protein n=1 Tax=Angiostrongylus cantonensis TaxID=6313 RepID=A0A0K0CVF0_ANGCA